MCTQIARLADDQRVSVTQVERLAAVNSLKARDVRIPGTLVDGVVVAKPENHHMSYYTVYNAGHAGVIRSPPSLKTMPMDERKLVARRGVLELMPNDVVNLGIGMAEGVALVAEEEKILSLVTLTTEPGVHGGVGAAGHDFGPASNYDALLEMHQQFDFYNGGGLDITFLGMAQITSTGDVNVTRVGPRLKGPGGFIDISQCTKRVNLVGSFTAGDLEVDLKDGKLVIVKEGGIKKFVNKIPEVTFSGAEAVRRKQIVNYITERCVFSLTPEGLELVEIAPGIDLQTQILDLMEFKPIMKRPPRLMDARIFRKRPMELLGNFYSVNMDTRLHYNEAVGKLFIDLHAIHVNTPEAQRAIRDGIEAFFKKHPQLVKKLDAYVNMDRFDVRDELVRSYADQEEMLEAKYFKTVRRVSSTSFMRNKLADSLKLATKSTLTFDEVEELLQSRGHTLAPETIRTLCQRFDYNKDGVVDSAEMSDLLDFILAKG